MGRIPEKTHPTTTYSELLLWHKMEDKVQTVVAPKYLEEIYKGKTNEEL